MWLSSGFVGALRATSLDAFRAQHGSTYFMLVALDEPAGELTRGRTAVTPGCIIPFGAIDRTLYTPETLWQTLSA